METKTLSTAMSICEKDSSCRKFYVTQSHIDDRSYYHYCGFHSQDAEFSLDQSTQYTLYTKKGKNHMIIGSIYYDSLYSINIYNTMKKYEIPLFTVLDDCENFKKDPGEERVDCGGHCPNSCENYGKFRKLQCISRL